MSIWKMRREIERPEDCDHTMRFVAGDGAGAADLVRSFPPSFAVSFDRQRNLAENRVNFGGRFPFWLCSRSSDRLNQVVAMLFDLLAKCLEITRALVERKIRPLLGSRTRCIDCQRNVTGSRSLASPGRLLRRWIKRGKQRAAS